MAMEKTTAYLPTALKAELDRATLDAGRSAAEIIREGISLAVAQRMPAPTMPILVSADPYFAEQVDERLAGFGEP